MSDELFNNTGEKENPSLFDVQLDPVAQQHIAAISQWGRIIAFLVLGLMGIAVLVLMGARDVASQEFVIPGMTSGESWGMLITVILVMVIVIGVWLFFLLKGAKLLKDGLAANDTDSLAAGFRMIRIFFTISMVLSVLSILGALINMF